jgi:hypothetical protein
MHVMAAARAADCAIVDSAQHPSAAVPVRNGERPLLLLLVLLLRCCCVPRPGGRQEQPGCPLPITVLYRTVLYICPLPSEPRIASSLPMVFSHAFTPPSTT